MKEIPVCGNKRVCQADSIKESAAIAFNMVVARGGRSGSALDLGTMGAYHLRAIPIMLFKNHMALL